MALSHHLADEETQAQKGFVTYLKSMNISFEFEPDSNVYILDHCPVDLRVCCLDTISMDCKRCYLQKGGGWDSVVKLI